VRLTHYSRRTEKAYVDWIRRYIVFHQKKHPSAMGATEIVAFLSWLAVDRRVSASTQNQALSALVFLYSQVLGLDIGPIEHVPRARMPGKLPVVLSREEIARLITHVDGMMWLIVALLYGTGLRLEECVGLRVKDLDFDRHQIVVRRGKGQKDRKYPGAPTEWGWQFVFPASRICRDPKWDPPSRFHLHESAVQRAVTNAARQPSPV
jgi:integrase